MTYRDWFDLVLTVMRLFYGLLLVYLLHKGLQLYREIERHQRGEDE